MSKVGVPGLHPIKDTDDVTVGVTMKREKELLNALMVLDVTIACLEPFVMKDELGKIMAGQIQAARDAYREVTGEEPMQLRKCPVATEKLG